jgi:SAM-dependent methyltransferase
MPDESPMRRMELFLDARPHDEYFYTHHRRYLETWRRLHPLLDAGGVREVLELGMLSEVGRYMRDALGLRVGTVESDLRLPFPLPDACADLVLCLEVVEHLNDVHPPGTGLHDIALFRMSGARGMFAETRRILRPGGWLVLTTPNAGSIDVIGNALRRRHPYQYPPHVREYTPAEILDLAAEAGFAAAQATTFFAWNSRPDIDREALMAQLAALGFDMTERGDDAYFAFRAPPA